MIDMKDVKRRVMMGIARAVVRAVTDTNGRQQLQIEATKGELIDGVERMQNYGFTSNPAPGCDAAVVFVSGNREQGIVVAVDDRRYRLAGLAAGEVAMYDDLGNKIEFKRDKMIITAVTATEIVSPSLKITGNVEIIGNVLTTGQLKNNGKFVGSTHTHSGVTVGAGNTGVVN